MGVGWSLSSLLWMLGIAFSALLAVVIVDIFAAIARARARAREERDAVYYIGQAEGKKNGRP
jgi:hypothetical protein